MEEMKPDTEVKEETSVPEEGAAAATAEKPAKKPHTARLCAIYLVHRDEPYRVCASNDHCAIRR